MCVAWLLFSEEGRSPIEFGAYGGRSDDHDEQVWPGLDRKPEAGIGACPRPKSTRLACIDGQGSKRPGDTPGATNVAASFCRGVPNPAGYPKELGARQAIPRRTGCSLLARYSTPSQGSHGGRGWVTPQRHAQVLAWQGTSLCPSRAVRVCVNSMGPDRRLSPVQTI
jgi:hypothetical protein